MNEESRKWLYDNLRMNGYNVGNTFEDFSKLMDTNEASRKWCFERAQELGYNVGKDYNQFNSLIGPKTVQQPVKAAPAQQTAVKPAATTKQEPVTTPKVEEPTATPAAAAPTIKTGEETPEQGGWTPSWQQRMGAQMMLDNMSQQMKQSQQDFSTRMENIRKGTRLGGNSDMQFNPTTGKMERHYYTTKGDDVSSPFEQSRLNLKYRDEWENTTEEGRKHRERRIQSDFERRVDAVMSKYDPDNAALQTWSKAEQRANAEFQRKVDERTKPSWSNIVRGAAEGTSVTGGLGADNWDLGVEAFATHFKHHDLQRMANEAWNSLGKEKQQAITDELAYALKNRYPDATDEQIRQAAAEMAREQSDRRMYEVAIAMNAPQDAAEYFIRKATLGTAFGKLMQASARAKAGTRGDLEARDIAEQQFEENGHKVAGIAGTVTGFAIDPLTWLSAGAGGAAVKGTTWLGGRIIGEAAMRQFGTTLGGRLLGGAVGGAVNFGTFEAGSEMLDQARLGGYRDPETGELIDGFSAGAVGERFGHGLMMGAATGMISPLIGNVSDKLVRATESTAGKLAIRTGELGVGTLAEGTVFSIPEWIEGNRDAMDVWTDNMAMMAGFKLQHAIKSAPRTIYELSKSPGTTKAGFETRLRSMLDGRGDLALTADEKNELERGGYKDLSDLTEDYMRFERDRAEQAATEGQRQNITDPNRMLEEGALPDDVTRGLPYNRFIELMNDGSISEAARAKMYYYLTGRQLPMSTVMGSSIIENKDADGNAVSYVVQSVGANGVITSRTFADKGRAQVELNRINRQAELNGIDVGERYYDWQGDNRRMWEACEQVAEETGAPANMLFELMKNKTETMNDVELEWSKKIISAYDGLGEKYSSAEIRTAINGEYDVDVDKAIRKERDRRSEAEQQAIDEYASRLYADVKRKQEEAADRGETPINPDAPTTGTQIAALLGVNTADGEEPADAQSRAFQRGHEADAQERRDIAMELAADDPNNASYAEREEAWNGVVQRINDDADYMVAQRRELDKKTQHADGGFHIATLKEQDSDGHDKQVYIVDGNVQMMADGTKVDSEASDKSVVIYDPTTGERRMIDPASDTGISRVDGVISAEENEAQLQRDRQQYVQNELDKAQGTVTVQPGQQLVLPTGEEAVVVATDGENVTVALADGTQANVQRSELQRIADEQAMADYRQRHGIVEEPAPAQPAAEAAPQQANNGQVSGLPGDYYDGLELTIRDEDGSEKPAMVMARVRYENGNFVPDAHGNIIEYMMDGEVKHDRIDQLDNKVVSYAAPQPQVAPEAPARVEEPAPAPAETPAEEPVAAQPAVETPATAAPVAATTEAPAAPQVEQPAAEPQQPIAQPAAEEAPQAMPMKEDGEEDWQATTPERAHAYIFNEAGLSRSEGNQFVAANIDAATKALAKAKAAQMPQVGTSIKKYNEAKAKRQEKIDEAQALLDYWNGVRNIQNGIQQEENERRAAKQAVNTEQAIQEEQQRQAEELAKQQEQAERGAHAAHPAIREKWEAAPKVDGFENEITLANGERVKGHYVLVESGAATPSHNPNAEFIRNEGFPVDENGQTVNDRDYERDKDAQTITRRMGDTYDSRAIQSVPVVSSDGIVLSGNGRTMAGELAAQHGTDGAYIEHLQKYGQQYGFTPEQVQGMQHPRLVFVPDEAMPYTTDTFAKFNAQEMKGQSKTEQAVKLGKVVDDNTFGRIIRSINSFDTLGEFYNDPKAATEAINELRNAGAIGQMDYAEMFDGDKVSEVGRQMLENMLIGKAFESNPDAVRQLTEIKSLRQSVINALAEVVTNMQLGEDYTLEGELAQAIDLAYKARKNGYKDGERVSGFARQLNLFPFDEGETIADYNNATVLMLADVMNDSRTNQLKKSLAIYNHHAADSAAGQMDIFSGGVQGKEDIIKEVLNILNYGTEQEQQQSLAAAVEQRKTAAAEQPSGGSEGVQQNGTLGNGDNTGETVVEQPQPVSEPAATEEPSPLAVAEQETDTNPTEAQKAAGNYKKGHVKIDGFDVSIENPKGSTRSGKDASGKEWSITMNNTYGYIRGTEGVDGDHIDVFFSDTPEQGDVFVVDQVNKDGSFDEHKVMYGFADIESARKAYLSNYEDGWQGLGAITPVSKEEFKKWIDSSHRKTKPFAEYSSVKSLGDTQLGDNVEPGFEARYDISPKSYTTKRGKTLDMQLLKFPNELTKEQQRAAASLARDMKGWWSKEDNGFMLRSVDDAERLAATILDDEAVQDAQPLSVEDVKAVNDQAGVQAVDEAIKVEPKEQVTPKYDPDREDEVYDTVLTGLRDALNNGSGIPNIKAIEKQIRDLRQRAKTLENGLATAGEETVAQGFAALADTNGRLKAYNQFLSDVRQKMRDTERDDALAAHGVKLGDKIMYKGKEAIIHDADHGQVTLDTGHAPVLYEVADWEDVELPKQEPAAPQPKKVNIESLVGELNEKGEAKLSDHAEEVKDEPKQETTEQPKQEEQKAKSKWVDDADAERFEELRKRLRQKLGGQLNMGIDPEAFTIGVEMSYLMLKHGARKFGEFAKQMLEALGENVRPYLKSFYNGARDLPEMAEFEKELTPYDEVRTFDVMNFDKQGAKDIIATAEHIVREQAAEREAKEATDKLKQERNEQRKETEQQTAANTAAVVSEAETVANQVEDKLTAATSEREVNDIAKDVDDAIEKVNDQLALLGYYEAEPVESDFNEAYGYMRNAEKKAVKNVSDLYKTIVKELGISDPTIFDAKGKKQKNVTANIAPIGGDVSMRFMLNRDKGVELYINFQLDSDYENNRDNLVLKGIMFRPERNLPNGGRDYLRANNYFPVDVTVPQMLQGIRSVCQEWLPAEDYVAMAQRIAAKNEAKTKENKPKTSKSKKKSVSLQEQSIPDLFSGLFGEDELNSKSNDTARTDEAKGSSRQDGTVGSVPADRDRVLDTASTGRTDRGETARVSDEAGAVADGERGELPSRGSQGGATRVDNVASETGQPLSDGGRSIRNGAASDGRGHDNRAAAATSDGVPSQTGAGSTGGRREQLAERRVRATKQPEPKFTRNYLYPEDASEIDNMTPQQRLKANVEALEIVRTLMQEGRQATAEEREVLGRYRGWGGVELGRAYSTSMMRKSFTDRWGAPTEQGKLLIRLADVIDALDPNGERGVLSAINHAALTSYYTPTGVAKVMNRFAELAGFKGGNMLDPSMGNGIFEGTMSKAVQQRTMIHGVELDWLTGQIARNLYPDANVLVTGYQDAGTADNAYDVVMSNIPFGDFSVTDKAWKHDSSPVRKAAQNRIHNYFAVKMLDNTRPGGLCVIMTSNAILDTKGNQIIREHIADNAEVLGVVRLPDNTFKGAGTSVVTDVIFLRKYKDDTDRSTKRSDEQYLNNIEKPFLTSGELQLVNPTDGKSYKVAVNGYFTKNKGMMIGDAKAGGQYRADQFGLGSDMSTDELAAAMQKLVEKKIVGDRKGKLFDTHKTVREVKQAVSEAYKGDGSYISSGNIVEQDGMIGVVTSTKNKYGDVNSTFTEMPELKGKANRVRAMLPIRKAMKQVIDWQIQGMKESDLAQARAELQKAYDDFTKKFGRLNTKENDFLTEDIDGYTLRSLEKWKDGKFVGLSDIFTKNTIKPALDLSTAKTPQEAISLSLAEYGEINSAFMEDVLGESWAEQCGETLFKEPFTTDSYLTADAYLSGDVKTKLEQAREAAKEDKALERNVKALEAVQPKDIPFDEISIRMGARWIPSEMYTDFMYDLFGIHKNDWKGNKSGVEYMPEVDQYVVNVAPNELGGEADQWRTSRRSASEVFTAALQDKSLSVFDTIKEDGKETKILNKEETELLNGKIQDLRTAFEDWLSQNPDREEALMRLYNDKFNRTVLRKFDGSHLRIPGLMGMELRPYQKDAVWMLINNRGGIVDHIVGAGKTLVMQSAIMEMRRMGIAKKPMIIGLKATCAQIAKEFREAYPAARILAPTERDFSKENRKKFMSQIALNDYDCVILSHDQYCMLPHTEEVERGVIDEQMAQLDAAIEFLYGQSDKNQLTKKQIKGLEKRKANLEAKLASLLDRKIDREFTFEGLGVDYLFVDECQHFKSLPYVSTYDRVAGLGDKKGSQRAIALLNGVRYLQKMHQGDRGTVFLSGTTISNSLSEIYHLLNYLRPSEMEKLGMTTFDAWAGNYAIHTAELEYGVTNELKEKDRFRSLTNIPELSKMYAEIADVRNDMNLKLPKPKMRSHIVTVPQSDLMTEINAEIVNMVRNKDGHYFGIDSKDTTPWGLLASTLSAKAAINPRLIDDAYEDEGGKIPAVCEQVKKIYDQFKEQKGTQLIFCDTGVSSKGKKYDAYSDIINRLVNDYGIPRSEIADIHIADTDEKRKALFAKVNEGSVRILIGGTKNMGTGVNVQKRIVAMHHVDVPWTPADREQREGRGVRQGNEIARDFNDDNVDVYFYATEGSLDMYKYQLQETKGKLFAQFKSGTIGERTFDEGDAEGDFDPAEVVAMLSGNPVIFEKSKQDKKVEKLRRAKRAYESDWQRRRSRYEELQTKQRNFERLISLNESDVRSLERGGFTPDEEGKYPATVTIGVRDEYSSRRTFDKPKEAGEYLHSLLKQGKKVELSGFGQKANVTVPITEAGLFGKPVAELDSYGGIKYTVDISDDDTAAGTAFRNLLQKVYTNKNVYERNLEDVKNQLRGADPGENKFPKQAELDEALKEKKRLDDEYKKLSDEKPKADEDTARYRIREDAAPTNTGVGYKVFVLKDGKLYPPMVANPNGEATPVGVWLDADAAPVAGVTKTGRQQVKAGGKGMQGGSGKLAYRPGWHLGEIPYALQFNRINPETGQRELFPANFVWAEVEYANDVDYNEEARSYGMNANGKYQHSLAGLPRVPVNGAYKYRTNPDPNTDPWVITGAMKVNRILKPSEVDAMVEAAGREPQQRQAGAITDEQVDALNREVQRTMKSDRDMMRTTAEQMGAKLNTRMNIIEDVNDITHPNKEIEARRRRSKGWFDTATGEVVIVLPNNRDVEDVAATIGHETVAHKGLRELVGEDNYNNFLDETYKHLRDDLKKGVDDAAGRAFIDDATKNGKSSKSYEEHRRTATDELFGRMAEKPFEEFSEGERTLWQKMCHVIRRLLDKFLGTLKLPKWFTLGDNEIRYILWRSKERLERGREDYVDMARDVVKREELGLTDAARYNMGDAPETFKARQKRAVEQKGVVMPGLNDAQVKIVNVPAHTYTGTIAEATQQAVDAAKAKYVPNGEPMVLHYDNYGAEFDYSISGKAIEVSLSPKHQAKSVNKRVHLSLAEHIDEVIGNSIEVEEHPDYQKNESGERDTQKVNGGALMHRFYGAVAIDGKLYRVMTLMREEKRSDGMRNGVHAYEVQKIEVLDETPNTPNGTDGLNSELEASSAVAKLLQNVEKSYEKGKNLLAESKKTDEDTAFYRDGDETGDIWSDQSMGLQERMTAAATRLANNHRDNKTLRNDAMRAIGGNLADLRRAMSLQRTFDMTTVKRVADLARVLMDGGYLNGLTQQEVKRLLAAVKNSVGHEDIESSVQKVMDIMVDNQLKHAEETLHSLESIRGSKVDARGVEVIGQLDPAGAHTMQVFKKARGWEKTDIEEAIADAQQRMGSSDTAVADEAALDYTGLQLAMDYAENIKDSKTDERKLRDEIKQAHDTTSERDRATDAYRQYIASLNEAIRQNKIERAQAYFDLVGRMSGSLRESIANAQDFKEAEKQRIAEIQHNANSDMQGRASDEHYKPKFMDKFVNNSFVSFMFAPLATFDQMLRLFGNKSANGEGYLYNRFMRGWVDARQKEIKGVRSKYATLDAKAAEIFGGKVKTWGDLIRRVGKLPKATVSFWNGGEMQERELTQGNLMYIYMVNKMLDGRMKLRKMGITEEDVTDIENALDPRLLELADWLQNEFLVETRNEYNETHKRMFGASMAAIENYFPLKILANARADKPEDLDNPDKGDGISTATGSIIKRRRNALALDITGADALNVILDHVAQMEHWNAYAEFNRDLNTLRTYKRFRNQVQNMTTIYGSGNELWRKFNDVCQMAAGTYRPPRAKLDEAATNFAKGVTAAKVSFRIFTALKQFLSMPAYIPEARADHLLADLVNPVGAWKWSMEHLPIFNERWKSRMAGDPRLLKSDMDWKMWRTRIMQLASRAGMSPNAFVDALTVSIGAHAIYKTKLGQYLRDGYEQAEAERRAIQDAETLYNQTQQSSEGAFTSTMQVDRSWLSILFTVFRNASMAYQRQLHDAVRNLTRNLTPGQQAKSVEFMKKQMVRDGLEENVAEDSAKRKFRRQILKDILRVGVFGYVMQWAWNLGAYLPYLLFGDDDEEKQKLWDDVQTHTAFGWLEGFTGGDVMSTAGNMLLSGEGNPAYVSKDMPLTSDIMTALQKLGNGQRMEAVTDMVNLVVQSGIGVNPQSITDGVLAIMDACGDDPALAHEAAICVSRILQVPQSQIDKMYFDEVGLSGDEVSKYTPAQLAERYARFKVKRGRVFAPWSWNDEERIGKNVDKANKIIKERTQQMGDPKVNEAYQQYEEVYKGVDNQVKAARKMAKTDYVGASQMMSAAQSDQQAFATYSAFKQLDKALDKVAGFYLAAKTQEEAALCRQMLIDYKAGMVNVLQASDEATRTKAMSDLSSMVQDFSEKYAAMQPKPQQLNR